MNPSRIPVCHRCRIHPGLVGIFNSLLQANVQVCASCLTHEEEQQIDAARKKAAVEPTLFEQQFGNTGPWRDQG